MAQHDNKPRSNGFTLLELIVAIVVSGFVVLALSRLLVTAVQNYSRQEQVGEMHTNVHYAIRRLTDMFAEVGAMLPDTGVAVVAPPTVNDSIAFMVNPRGGMQVFPADVAATQDVPVDDARSFRHASAMVKEVEGADGHFTFTILNIDTTCGAGNYVKGINKLDGQVRITAAEAFAQDNVIYAFRREQIKLRNNELLRVVNDVPEVLAENIDSLYIAFYDSTETQENAWNEMIFGSVAVRARTGIPDLDYISPTHGDRYRRVALDIKFRLRSKL